MRSNATLLDLITIGTRKIELSTRGLHQERQFLPKAGKSGLARLRHVPPLSGYWHNLVNVAARVFTTNYSNPMKNIVLGITATADV